MDIATHIYRLVSNYAVSLFPIVLIFLFKKLNLFCLQSILSPHCINEGITIQNSTAHFTCLMVYISFHYLFNDWHLIKALLRVHVYIIINWSDNYSTYGHNMLFACC